MSSQRETSKIDAGIKLPEGERINQAPAGSCSRRRQKRVSSQERGRSGKFASPLQSAAELGSAGDQRAWAALRARLLRCWGVVWAILWYCLGLKVACLVDNRGDGFIRERVAGETEDRS